MKNKFKYYFSGKVCVLYAKIAKQNGATPGQVERAIRYAFEGLDFLWYMLSGEKKTGGA